MRGRKYRGSTISAAATVLIYTYGQTNTDDRECPIKGVRAVAAGGWRDRLFEDIYFYIEKKCNNCKWSDGFI